MAFIGRVLWVVVAFLLACVAAGTVATLGLLLPEPSEAAAILSGNDTAFWTVALTAALISGYALIPAMLLVLVAEGFRLRSFLFYAVAGAAMALLLDSALSAGSNAPLLRFPLDHDSEVVLGSGIAAGLVYWLLAGRGAGEWREQRRQSGAPLAADGPARPHQDRA